MRKFIKTIICLVAAVLLAVSVCACGGNGGGDESTLKVTIRGGNTAEAILNQKLQNAFIAKKEKEGVTVKFATPSTFSAGTYMQSIDTLAGSNNLGDVVFTYDTNSGLEVKSRMFDALDSYIANDPDFNLADYDESIMESAKTYKNQIAFIPRSLDQMTVFINTDMFKELGMENRIPSTALYGANWENWTWDAMINLCQDIRTALDTKYGRMAAQYDAVAAKFFYNAVYGPVVESFGGNCVDVATMDSGFHATHPKYAQTIKALEWMQSLVAGKLTTSGEGNFQGGMTAMSFEVRTTVPVCVKSGINLAFAPMPKFTASQTGTENPTTYVGFGSGGYAINAASKNKQLAWEFIKFTASEEGQELIASNGACVPILKSMLTQNASWMQVDTLKKPDGTYIDQSAFIANNATRIPATYARGVAVQDEYTIYSDTKNFISNSFDLANFSAETLAREIYNGTAKYIKAEQ